MLLLRYIKRDLGLRAVQTGEFKLSRPLAANDPFEMMGACEGMLSEEVKRQFRDDLTYGWIKESMFPSGSGVLRPLPVVRDEAVRDAELNIKRVVWERTVFEQHEQMLCFSNPENLSDESDQLMWAHYGDCGRGVRIWFDTGKFTESHPPIYPVHYEQQRPVLDLGRFKSWLDPDVYGEFVKACMLTKSKAWVYEQECRMLIGYRADPTLLRHRDGMSFIVIPQSAIVRVDFGPKGLMSETEQDIRELRSNLETKHIEVRVASFHESGYGYVYKSYPTL